MTGGASEALRQEFREIELLDEITNLHYLGKLHKSVTGCTRNQLIKSFHEWKEHQYVPQNVHKSLRWSKKDPLNEGEIEEVCWKIVQTEKNTAQKHPVTEPEPLIQASTSLKQKLSKKDFKHNEGSTDKEPANKKPCSGLDNNPQLHRTLVPLGLQWMQNSCAYDASFVILYSLYNRNIPIWTTHLQNFRNGALNNILDGFQMLQQNQKTFEQVRDHIRRALEVDDYNYFRFGQFTSISTLWDHILRTPEAMRTTYYQCENGHKDHIMYEKTCAYSIGVNTNRCTTMSQWIASQPDLTEQTCEECSGILLHHHKFLSAQPLLALEFLGHDIQIDRHISIEIKDTEYVYNLVGIVYYGSDHFTARIISEDGQIWFHDGVTTGQTTKYDGSFTYNCPELYTCQGKCALLAIYSLDD